MHLIIFTLAPAAAMVGRTSFVVYSQKQSSEQTSRQRQRVTGQASCSPSDPEVMLEFSSPHTHLLAKKPVQPFTLAGPPLATITHWPLVSLQRHVHTWNTFYLVHELSVCETGQPTLGCFSNARRDANAIY